MFSTPDNDLYDPAENNYLDVLNQQNQNPSDSNVKDIGTLEANTDNKISDESLNLLNSLTEKLKEFQQNPIILPNNNNNSNLSCNWSSYNNPNNYNYYNSYYNPNNPYLYSQYHPLYNHSSPIHQTQYNLYNPYQTPQQRTFDQYITPQPRYVEQSFYYSSNNPEDTSRDTIVKYLSSSLCFSYCISGSCKYNSDCKRVHVKLPYKICFEFLKTGRCDSQDCKHTHDTKETIMKYFENHSPSTVQALRDRLRQQ